LGVREGLTEEQYSGGPFGIGQRITNTSLTAVGAFHTQGCPETGQCVCRWLSMGVGGDERARPGPQASELGDPRVPGFYARRVVGEATVVIFVCLGKWS
jgi:hypothetical protein